MFSLYAWANEPGAVPPDRHYQVVRLLVAAGAEVKSEWLDGERVRADPKMLAALNDVTSPE